jgi:hypothetical protein
MMWFAATIRSRGDVWILLSESHVQGRGRPFARHVCDEHAEPLVAEPEEVVVVAAHFSRGHAKGGYGQSGHDQRPLRQQGHLNLAGDTQLFFQALLFRRLPEQVLDAGSHRVERGRQLAQLIVGLDRNLVGEIALPHAFGSGEQLVNRSRDRLRQRKAGNERDELNHEKEAADDEENQQQPLAEVATDQSLRRRDAIVELGDAQLGRDHQRAGFTGRPISVLE